MTTIFNCADCRKAIKENSREHDDCWTNMEKGDDLWYCGDCKCDHMDDEDDAELIIPQAHNIGEFYTEEEQKKIFEALKAKFEAERREILEEGRRLLIKDGEKEVDGTCNMCGREGKYIADADDDGEWTCMKCAGWGSDSDEEVVCPRCDRTEKECEEQTENEKNPITDWCGGWGLSCDDCYYKAHPESDDEEVDVDDRDAPNTYPYKKCSECGERKSCGNYKENDWFCEDCYEEDDCVDDNDRSYGPRGPPAPESDDED